MLEEYINFVTASNELTILDIYRRTGWKRKWCISRSVSLVLFLSQKYNKTTMEYVQNIGGLDNYLLDLLRGIKYAT